MYYVLAAIAAYLVLGMVLARSVLKAPWHRMRFHDFVMGALFMPMIFVALLVFEFVNRLWKRLLIALDYNPPEEMRAGPQEFELNLDLDDPAGGDSKKTD